ncbi:uncharacterized protein cenpu isoform X2 [Stigmatopora argus]
MSTRKGRRAKMVPVAPVGNQKISLEPGNQSSSIDGATSFIQGLQQQNGNCMHSTAVEEDLNTSQNNQTVKRKVGDTLRKKNDVKASPLKNEQAKMQKSVPTRKRAISSEDKSDSEFKSKKRQNRLLTSDDDTDHDESWKPSPKKGQRQNRLLISDDDTDHDASWKPGPKKGQNSSVKRIPTKLSTDKVVRDRKKRERPQGETELDVVLATFLDFCEEYRDSVETNAIKQTIDYFSNNVKEQLLEKIALFKELNVLKRKNAKVCSKIRTNTHKLLDAKKELIRAERQVGLLQKEKTDMEVRIQDLQVSQTFLRDITELNKAYLDYRSAHPEEEETYDVTSLPALLLETKHVQGIGS